MHTLKPDALISLERHSVVMLVAYNLPRNALGIGIAGSPFLGVSVEVLAFCTLWDYLTFISFHWLTSFFYAYATQAA